MSKAAAKKNRNRQTVAFPPTDPWPERVDGEALLDELAVLFRRFIKLDEPALDAVALWSVHAHAHDARQFSPILIVSAAGAESGKSTLLGVISALVPNRMQTSDPGGMTAFVRATEYGTPTLLLDEADTYLRQHTELIRLLNGGHSKGGAPEFRVVGHDVVQFTTWAPKVVAGIALNKLPETLLSRSIFINMRRKSPGDPLEDLILDDAIREFAPLRQRLTRWTRDHFEQIRAAKPAVPEPLGSRGRDNWRTLLALSATAGPRWEQRAFQAAEWFAERTKERAGETPDIRLLADIRAYMQQSGKANISTAELLKHLHRTDKGSWMQWKRGKPLTAQDIAKMLKRHGIRSHQYREGATVQRGYDVAAFENAFAAYLPTTP